ncbi:sugar phosphate isomerase/epimerase family protein [Peribacillus frigoritolerans]|uniref:sugar phosphate isomerase/epimerase family protein n=1 Tax=Peribacillus frigoritolerans TaxID=450367 RepID=UPI00105A10D1|nr:sugar phosphate isomerase/epimerase [Peribacillus frigoritolerans]TDL82742.1 sugar phosphate isomerase/epimerase [Peribacillus frigoritolerans]
MNHVIIPLNAFDRKEVLENGQFSFISMIKESGAYGAEIRRELFTEQELPLKQLRDEIASSLFIVYSAPVELWKTDGFLNEEEILKIREEALLLGARWVKVSLGHYIKGVSDLEKLNQLLNQFDSMELLIENDQTLHGGNAEILRSFYESASIRGVPVKMTFDTGNWLYTNENPIAAFGMLKEFVAYLHLKNVVPSGNGFITTELTNSEKADWRKIAEQLPENLPIALEFPIHPVSRLKEFIGMVHSAKTIRKGEAVCKS